MAKSKTPVAAKKETAHGQQVSAQLAQDEPFPLKLAAIAAITSIILALTIHPLALKIGLPGTPTVIGAFLVILALFAMLNGELAGLFIVANIVTVFVASGVAKLFGTLKFPFPSVLPLIIFVFVVIPFVVTAIRNKEEGGISGIVIGGLLGLALLGAFLVDNIGWKVLIASAGIAALSIYAAVAAENAKDTNATQ